MPGGIAPRGLSLIPVPSTQTFSPSPDRERGARGGSRAPRSLRARRAPGIPALEQLAPAGGSGFVTALPPRADGERPKRLHSDRRQPCADQRSPVDRRCARAVKATARSNASSARSSSPAARRRRQAPALRARRRRRRARPPPDERRGRSGRQRQQIQPVVLEDAASGRGSPAADELKIPRRNFEAWRRRRPAHAEHLLFERRQRTARLARAWPQNRRAGCSRSTCGTRRARRFETVKQIARFEHRRVERLAVERHQRAGAIELRATACSI